MSINRSRAVLEMDASDYVRDTTKARTSTAHLGKEVQKTDRKLGLMAKTSARAGKMTAANIAGIAAGATALLAAGASLDRFMEGQVEYTNVMRNLRISVDGAAEAVGHQTDKLVLAKQANKLFDAGVVKTSQELSRLDGVIAGLADRAGVDLNRAIEGTTKSLIKGNDRAFEMLGLTSDLEAEQRLLAASLGKTMEELSDAENQQLVLNLLLEKGEAALSNNTEKVDTAAHSWASWKNQLKDWINEVPTELGQSFDQIGRDIENFSINVLTSMGQSWKEATTNTRRFESALGDVTDFAIANATLDIDGMTESLGRLNRTFSTFGKISNSQAVDSARKTQEATAEAEQKAANALAQQARQAQREKLLMFHQAPAKKRKRSGGRRGGGLKQAGPDLSRGRTGRDAFATDDLELEIQALDQQIEIAELRGSKADDLYEQRLARASLLARAEGDRGELLSLQHDEKVRMIQQEITAEELLEQRREEWMEAQRKRAEEEIALRMQVLDVVTSTTSQTLSVISQGVDQYAKTEEQRLLWQKGAEALDLGIKAVSAGVKAGAAFAAFNYPQGAAHLAEAAILTAGVGLVLSKPSNPAAGLSGGGGGGTNAAFAGGSRGPRPTIDAPEIPISPAELGQPANGAGRPTSNGTTVNQTINVTGLMDERGAKQLKREMDRADRGGSP